MPFHELHFRQKCDYVTSRREAFDASSDFFVRQVRSSITFLTSPGTAGLISRTACLVEAMHKKSSKPSVSHRIMQVVNSSRLVIPADCTMDGGTKDGYVATSQRDGVVDRSNVLPAGQAQRLALVSDLGWGGICRRPSYGVQLAACGGPEQGLQEFLLFPVERSVRKAQTIAGCLARSRVCGWALGGRVWLGRSTTR